MSRYQESIPFLRNATPLYSNTPQKSRSPGFLRTNYSKSNENHLNLRNSYAACEATPNYSFNGNNAYHKTYTANEGVHQQQINSFKSNINFSLHTPPMGNGGSPKLRGHGSGVKSVLTVAGPTLATTRFNSCLDSGVLANVNSPGFSSRIARCSEEALSPRDKVLTHQPQYSGPRQYPIVQLTPSKLPVLSSKNSQKVARTQVRVRIAPPSSCESRFYALSEKNQPLSENSFAVDDKEAKQSVLEALKEFSHKRIHVEMKEDEGEGEEEEDDVKKRVCTRCVKQMWAQNKRMREDSPPDPDLGWQQQQQQQPTKKTCNNEISSSLSSSRNMHIGGAIKRKTSAADWSRCSTPVQEKQIKISNKSPADQTTSPPNPLLELKAPTHSQETPMVTSVVSPTSVGICLATKEIHLLNEAASPVWRDEPDHSLLPRPDSPFVDMPNASHKLSDIKCLEVEPDKNLRLARMLNIMSGKATLPETKTNTSGFKVSSNTDKNPTNLSTAVKTTSVLPPVISSSAVCTVPQTTLVSQSNNTSAQSIDTNINVKEATVASSKADMFAAPGTTISTGHQTDIKPPSSAPITSSSLFSQTSTSPSKTPTSGTEQLVCSNQLNLNAVPLDGEGKSSSGGGKPAAPTTSTTFSFGILTNAASTPNFASTVKSTPVTGENASATLTSLNLSTSQNRLSNDAPITTPTLAAGSSTAIFSSFGKSTSVTSGIPATPIFGSPSTQGQSNTMPPTFELDKQTTTSLNGTGVASVLSNSTVRSATPTTISTELPKIFGFGAVPTTKQASQPGGFSFGTSPAPAPTTQAPQSNLFDSGTSPATTGEASPAPSFLFGGVSTTFQSPSLAKPVSEPTNTSSSLAATTTQQEGVGLPTNTSVQANSSGLNFGSPQLSPVGGNLLAFGTMRNDKPSPSFQFTPTKSTSSSVVPPFPSSTVNSTLNQNQAGNTTQVAGGFKFDFSSGGKPAAAFGSFPATGSTTSGVSSTTGTATLQFGSPVQPAKPLPFGFGNAAALVNSSSNSTVSSSNISTPTQFQASFGNVFGSPSQQQQSSATPSSQAAVGTFAFGATGSSVTSTQNQALQSGSFNFGSSSTPVSKPGTFNFGSVYPSSQAAGAFNFGGSTSTPPSQVVQPTGAFSFGNSTNTATAQSPQTSTGFSFGSTKVASAPEAHSSYHFGSSPNPVAAQPLGSMFGQATANTAPTSTPGGMFGQPTMNNSQASTSGGMFGQSSTNATPTSTPGSMFGQPATNTTPVSTAGGMFGQPTTNTAPGSTPGGMFGQPTTNTAPGSTSGGMFGQPTTNTAPSSTAGGMFGQPTTNTAPGSTGGMFGQPTTNTASGSTPGSMFGQPTTNTAPGSTPGNIFGQPTTNTAPGSTPGGMFGQPATNTAPGSTPVSMFGQPTTITAPGSNPGGMFGQPTTNTASGSTPGSMFGQPTTNTAPGSTPGGMFGQPATNAVPGSTPGGMFGQPATASQTPAPIFGQSATNTSSLTPGGMFGQVPQTQPSSAFQFGGSSSGSFNFGGTGVNPLPAPAMNFGAGPSTANPFGLGTPSFGSASAAQGMFSIGSGSTAPRTRSNRGRRTR